MRFSLHVPPRGGTGNDPEYDADTIVSQMAGEHLEISSEELDKVALEREARDPAPDKQK